MAKAEKTSLTPEERLRAAYFHLVVGWHQHDIAAFMNVNPGRVAEAVVAIRHAANDPKAVYEMVKSKSLAELLDEPGAPC